MEAWELFNFIKDTKYKTVGKKVDYAIRYKEKENTLYLMFQQSQGLIDWLVNFSFIKKPYKQQERVLWYHGGYCNAWKSCNDYIMESFMKAYNELKSRNPKIQIIGWSYGGAMSQIAAEDLNYRYGIKPEVITFGSPEPFWGKKTVSTVADCCAYVKNYSHVNDIVPYLPPFPFWHCVNKIILGNDFCLLKLFNPGKYHCIYGDKTLYYKKEIHEAVNNSKIYI